MKFTFCPKCGNTLHKKEIGDEGKVPYCDHCKRPFFDMPSTCTINAVINEYNEVALIRQSYGKDMYVCVAGYLKIGESAEECAAREIEEEIGIKPYNIEFVESYPMEAPELLMLGFTARVKKAEFTISFELKEAKWFNEKEALDVLQKENATIAYKLVEKSFEK